MNSQRIFTRKRLGLDNNIWIVMIVTSMLSATLPAYKMISKTDAAPCIAPKILVNGIRDAYLPTKIFKTNEPLWFRAPVAPGISITWNFDDSTKTEEGFSARHVFTKPRVYMVSATVNGDCITRIKIIIKEPLVRDSTAIIGNDQVPVGDCSFYTDYTAGSYKWVIEDNGNFTPQYTKACTFKFRVEGVYTIILVLDNDPEKTYRKDIVVTDPTKGDDAALHNLMPDDFSDLPNEDNTESNHSNTQQQDQSGTQQNQNGQVNVPPANQPTDAPPVKRKIGITDKQLKLMLESVLSNAMHAEDFDRYLCSGTNTKVYVNDEKKPITFSQLCERLLGNDKKIAIESATIVFDPDNKDCETNLAVKYKKKGIRLF